MRPRTLLSACIALAALASSAPTGVSGAPQWDGPVADVHIKAFDAAGDSWFEVDGLPGRNPDIPIQPGVRVTLHFTNNGTMPHNVFVTALGGVPCCVAPGGSATGSFTAPTADTNLAYLCDLHEATMHGRFVVGEGADKGTPIPGYLVVVALGLALLSIRKRLGGMPRRRTR